jgi:hypothetical protein
MVAAFRFPAGGRRKQVKSTNASLISILPSVSALSRRKQKTADAGQETIMSPEKLVTRENENPDPVEKQWDPGF